jgi:hypothetical protein
MATIHKAYEGGVIEHKNCRARVLKKFSVHADDTNMTIPFIVHYVIFHPQNIFLYIRIITWFI